METTKGLLHRCLEAFGAARGRLQKWHQEQLVHLRRFLIFKFSPVLIKPAVVRIKREVRRR